VFELLDGHVSMSRIRKIEIADLLRRPQVVGRAEQVSYLEGRTVLITGAGGSIGAELSRQVAFSKPKQLVLLGHGENSIFSVHSNLRTLYPGVRLHPVIADVRDLVRLNAVFGRFKPDVVFHAAAHKHVPLMEANPGEAITNNVLGTQCVVDAALECGSERLVFISTDKAVSPNSFMGASKRIAGMVVREAAARSGRAFVVVRFGNVLGSRGSVVPIFKQQIEGGGPVTVTHPDMKRFFMTIPEAVHLVLQAGGMGDGGEMFVLNMGEQIRIVDLANDLIRLSGFTPEEIPIVFTGARPGEKIEEQLWEAGAVVASTSNREVLKVTESEGHPQTGLAELIHSLQVAAERDDRLEIEALLAKAISTFVRVHASDA
jgi:FlaA1/EpsC-like NDP-sugar epimerase